MIFIVFDIEIIFFYPWALSHRSLGLFGLVAVGMFALAVFEENALKHLGNGGGGSGSFYPPVATPGDGNDPYEELNEDDLLEHEPVSQAITAENQPVLFPVADEMEIEVDAQALYIEEYPTSVPQGDGCFVSLRKPSKLL